MRASANPWVALIAIQAGVLLSILDSTVVNVAIPDFMARYQVTLVEIDWVIISYRIALAALLLPAGRLADIAGRKPVWLSGLALFSLGSALCWLAPSVEVLIAARVVQGVGGALIVANAAGMVAALFPPERRGRALGVNATVLALGAAIGPTLGAYLAQTFGPNSVFTLNVPVGLAVLAFSWVVLDARTLGEGVRGTKFDFPGVALAMLALVAVLVAADPPEALRDLEIAVPGMIVLAAAAAIGFIVVEQRVDAPMLTLSLFRHRAISLGFVALLLAATASSLNLLLLPLYLELVLALATVEAGLFLLAASLGIAVVGPIGGRLTDAFGARRLTTTGLALIAASFAALGLLGRDAAPALVVLPLLALGIGYGLFQPANQTGVMNGAPREALGTTSALLGLGLNLGILAGNELATDLMGLFMARAGGLAQLTQPPLSPDALAAFLDGRLAAYGLAVKLVLVAFALAFSNRAPAPPVAPARASART